MLRIHKLTFNPFMENTYIVADETKECVIIDPGCHNERERLQLQQAIEANGYTPVRLLNTHCHIDHFPGNKFVCDTYSLLPEFHEIEYQVMKGAMEYQSFFGMSLEESPAPKNYLKEGDVIAFGNSSFSVLFTPGHSPGHLAFYCRPERKIFSGDVLFQGSVGRYDIPGASGEVLYKSLTEKMMTLPDEVVVYSGHGPETTIGQERRSNPFLHKAVFFQN